MSQKETTLLNLLQDVYRLETTKNDADFANLVGTAIQEIEAGEAVSLPSVRLTPFLNKHLWFFPSKELVALQIFLQREANNYKGLLSAFNWL